MNKENTQKLVKRFPLMYRGFYKSMRETCMCWGFECGDGWFDILWMLSLAIEDELGYSKWYVRKELLREAIARRWNDFIYKVLSPVGEQDMAAKVADVLMASLRRKSAHPSLGFKRFRMNGSSTFSVSQVKEKFGTLRFYQNGSDRIDDLVDAAEHATSAICEVCGQWGSMRGHGWYYVACDEHTKEHDKDVKEQNKE